jgi:hypothetical protein
MGVANRPLGVVRPPQGQTNLLLFFFFQPVGVAEPSSRNKGWLQPPQNRSQGGGQPQQKNLQIVLKFFINFLKNKSNILLLFF